MKNGILSILLGIIWIGAFVWLVAIVTAFMTEIGVFHYIGKGQEGRTALEQILTPRFGADIMLLLVIYGAFYAICVRLGAVILERVSEFESTMWKKVARKRREKRKKKGIYDYNKYKYERD